jgi:hypothetical protein
MTGRTLLDLERTWTRDDRAEDQIRVVPVEVPRGVGALGIELAFEGPPGSVLDIGLEGPSSYAGWSGGARSRVVVGEEWSTPGYLPTPPVEGVWHVLVGLHRIPQPGVRMRLQVRAIGPSEVESARASEPEDPPPVERPPGRGDLPREDGMTWLAGDFHSHTVHSDGALSIGGLAALAASRGLDFLAVTDHNTTSHHAHLPSVGRRHGIDLLPGQEVTRDVGHANAFGDIGFVDFRHPPTGWAAAVEARGGILSVNHPLSGDCAWLSPLDPAPATAEVWHSSWSLVPTWGAPLAWWAMTPGTTPIGGSDFHHHGEDGLPGSPTTWVQVDGDHDVLTAVRAGRTAVSRSADGPVLLRQGEELVALDADGLLVTGPGRARRPVRGDRFVVPAEPGPWWLEDDVRVVHALCG